MQVSWNERIEEKIGRIVSVIPANICIPFITSIGEAHLKELWHIVLAESIKSLALTNINTLALNTEKILIKKVEKAKQKPDFLALNILSVPEMKKNKLRKRPDFRMLNLCLRIRTIVVPRGIKPHKI